MSKVALFIRKVTIPPVFAVVLLVSVYFSYPKSVESIWHVIGGIFFLALLPVLAYPLQKYIPKFKDKGRDGQRCLAMLFSFAGYLLGTVLAFALGAPEIVKLLYAEYLLCGISMLVLNKVFHMKASGHACGVVGPVFMMLYLRMYIPAAVCAALVIPVFASSLKIKRHTVGQLLGGSAIPLVALLILHFLFSL